MSGWGCPHNIREQCDRVPGKACDPGMKGCTMFGRFRFASPEKNISNRKNAQAKRRAARAANAPDTSKGAF